MLGLKPRGKAETAAMYAHIIRVRRDWLRTDSVSQQCFVPGLSCHRSSLASFSLPWPSFDINHIQFSHVTLFLLPGQSSSLNLMSGADTGLQGWLNRNYTHLAPGHSSTRAMHKWQRCIQHTHCFSIHSLLLPCWKNPKIWMQSWLERC